MILIKEIRIIKMFILPKALCRFNGILVKIPMTLSIELKEIILIFVWNHKRPPKVK